MSDGRRVGEKEERRVGGGGSEQRRRVEGGDWYGCQFCCYYTETSS